MELLDGEEDQYIAYLADFFEEGSHICTLRVKDLRISLLNLNRYVCLFSVGLYYKPLNWGHYGKSIIHESGGFESMNLLLFCAEAF